MGIGMKIKKNMLGAIIAALITNTMMGTRGVYGLSRFYYTMSCPIADFIVKKTVYGALLSDPTLAAGLVRLHFHDCFIQGCDGSVLLNSTEDNDAEKDSPVNFSLRGYEVIDAAKEELEQICPGVVSCADIVAMAARDAVFFSGGPAYDIPNGRKDGRISKLFDTFTQLPGPSMNSSALISMFTKLGFTTRQMVALSGGHTLGVARCFAFKNRLSSFNSKNDVDPSMDAQFARALSRTCSAGDNTLQPLDFTKNTFDNNYFRALQKRAGLLFSDQTLFVSAATRGIVNAYAMNQAMFFMDFQQAMIKMGTMDVKEGSNGEVRTKCWAIN